MPPTGYTYAAGVCGKARGSKLARMAQFSEVKPDLHTAYLGVVVKQAKAYSPFTTAALPKKLPVR